MPLVAEPRRCLLAIRPCQTCGTGERENRAMSRTVYDWAAIQAFHDEGHGFAACRQRFGVTAAAWRKAIQRGRLRTSPGLFTDRRRKVDWAAVQRYYDEGHSYRDCRRQFGFCASSWTKAVDRGELQARARRLPLERVLGSSSRRVVKRYLLEAGILENRCSWCGITEWRGRPISIQIDHVNGISDDHRLENLRMLCPNCHSQTETFAARNSRKSARSQLMQR